MWLSPRCWRCTKVGQFGAALLLCELATRCDIGTAPCSKAWVMLRRSRQAGLQLVEVAKRNVTAARREKSGCRSYKRASWEAAQSRSSPDKWLLREEVAERKGSSSTKKSSSFIHPPIHPSTYPSTLPSIHSLVADSLIHWFVGSMIHWFIGGSLLHWFSDSFVHWFIGSLILSINCAWILSCHVIGIQQPLAHSLLHLTTAAPCCFYTSKTFLQSSSYSRFIFTKLPPRRVPGTTW